VFSFGDNQFGQLGLGKTINELRYIDWPTVIPNLLSIKKIACNHHSAAIGSKGELYFWGTGVFGTYLSPRMVLDKNICEVNIGGCFGLAKDKQGLLWTWG
jgi:alpha-tubulin suppressor-like RCC1 family protein